MISPAPPLWRRPPASLSLAANEVHVWRVALDVPPAFLRRLHCLLAADERQRAERFFFQKDREHFVAARGQLRAILSRYVGVEPDRLCFCYSAHGKPALAAESGGETLRFNLSHSHGLALCAVGLSREIGVDLEYIRADLADEQIAERFFSAVEVATLRSLPVQMQPEAFFNCWTRKEAYIKGRGEGLSLPLDQFDVSLVPGEPARLLNTRGDPQDVYRWSLQALSPGAGYVAALAVEGHAWRLQCWDWPVA